MNHWNIPLGIILLILSTMFGDRSLGPLAQAQEKRAVTVAIPENPRVGHPAPEFALPDLRGNQIRLSDLRGKVVLVNFWATWCGPCRIEMPSMEELYREFKDQGFEILAISSDFQGPSITQPFKEQYQLTFPILHDPQLEANRRYQIRSIPASVLVGKDGVIIYRVPGARDWYSEKARTMVRQLLNVSEE